MTPQLLGLFIANDMAIGWIGIKGTSNPLGNVTKEQGQS